ncbi:MAG: SIR2 family protein [Xanthobacteraceae bacterium]|uniref:SIR2 family protein n=1 Tax=Pseudolabrys sp. TaxID=1960880 RepID=UPI003D108F7A
MDRTSHQHQDCWYPISQSGNLNFLIGSGASAPAIKTAGAIESEINQLLIKADEVGANKKCLEFIEQIDSVHTRILANTDDATIKNVTSSYSNFLTAIDKILFMRKNILLPRQANVFTTNYDMFLEHSSSELPFVILNDGFDRASSLSPDFSFAPERYFDRTYRTGPLGSNQSEIPTINLIKLHGSLSWRKKSDSILFDVKSTPKLTATQKNDPAQVAAYLERYFLILPNLRKFHTTLMERVYYDLLRLFSKAMDQQNVVLVSFGFSFVDEHILDISRRALRNPTAQLIVLSYDAASAPIYQTKFSKQRNVTIIAPKAGTSIDFAKFNTILNVIVPEKADSDAA